MPRREPSPGEIEAWAERLADAADSAVGRHSNEPGLISDLDPLIRDALRDLYGFDETAFEVEHDTLPKGAGYSPVDRVYGSVLVEYEWRMGAGRRRHGAEQALNYLSNLEATTSNPGAYTAVVTDGRQWGFLVDRPTTQLSLFVDGNRTEDDYFEWRTNSAGACRRFLQLCAAYDQTPVSGRALSLAFGPAAGAVQRFVTLLAAILDGRSELDRTDTLWREWARSTEVVYGVLDTLDPELATQLRGDFAIPVHLCDQFAELLFVVHTYFAVVARLVAVETLAIAWNEPGSRPSHWTSLSDADLEERVRKLDAGEVPSGIATIRNLFETDVFSWWVDHLDSELLAGFRDVLDIIGRFAFPRVAFGALPPTDLLRELYLRLVPRDLRRQLGEFPTPTWLAEASLERMASLGAPLLAGRVLDPCCGTGAFLLPLLRNRVTRLRLDKGDRITSADVQAALDGVAGMDINPIAVTATRANMLVALGSLAEVGGFRLPVWRTDSIVVPDVTPIQGDLDDPRLVSRKFLELRTSAPEPFPIPILLSDAESVAGIRRFLDAALVLSDRLEGKLQFLAGIASEFGVDGLHPATEDADDWKDACLILDVLFDRVRDLADAGRDGVWTRIIENSFAPLFIGHFDCIVGNPPWLGWGKLPTAWRSDAEHLWKRYGLWDVPLSPGETRTPRAQRNDIATLVFASALARYAANDGWVGFLTPDALIIGDPGARAFRQFRLRTDPSEAHDRAIDIAFAIRHCDNWSLVKPFGTEAANRPVFLIAQRDQKHTFPVPTARWQRAEAGTSLAIDWPTVRAQLVPIEGESVPADPAVPFSAWSFREPGVPLIAGGQNSWDFGMGVNTRGGAGILHVDVDRPKPATGTVRVANRPTDGRNKTVARHVGTIEAALVYPFLRGRDIRPWVASPSGHMVVTQDPNKLTDLLSEADFNRRYPHALAWLRRHRVSLEQRSVPNAGWDIKGRDWYRLEGPWAHLQGQYLVVLPEQALPPPAAVVFVGAMEFALGRKSLPLPNHKVVFCAVPSLEEAVYLVAVLNSGPMQSFLASYGASTAISPTTMSRLAIPPFTSLGDQARIVELGKSIIAAVDIPARRSEVATELDALVDGILGAEPSGSARRSATRPRRVRAVEGSPADERQLF